MKQCDKTIKYKQFLITVNNLNSANEILHEVFDEVSYEFETQIKNPVIIDAGSNIGITSLFFYETYAPIEMICFEPDPNAYKCLKANMVNNGITNCKLINAALTKQERVIDFYGDFTQFFSDARGNSIIKDWGIQREYSSTIKIKSVRLSDYIDQNMTYLLKLDIEGAEQQVLEDLESNNKLALIKEIVMEIHQLESMENVNNLDSILTLLKRNNFKCEYTEKNHELPLDIQQWVKKVTPRFFILRATKL